jgi:hypothetical protein
LPTSWDIANIASNTNNTCVYLQSAVNWTDASYCTVYTETRKMKRGQRMVRRDRSGRATVVVGVTVL